MTTDRKSHTPKDTPGWKALIAGILFPAAVIVFEGLSEFCASVFFNPIPTFAHIALVSLVPVSNLLMWLHLRDQRRFRPNLLYKLSIFAIAISGFYSLLFLPMCLMGIFAIPFYGIGLLPLAPAFSFFTARCLHEDFISVHQTKNAYFHHYAYGLALCLLFMGIAEAPQLFTKHQLNKALQYEGQRQTKAIQSLRRLGDHERINSAISRRSTLIGPLESIQSLVARKPTKSNPAALEEIYYRVTGESNNQRRNFRRTVGDLWEFGPFDNDLGGQKVGQHNRQLFLIKSEITGDIFTQEGLGYYEWILEFENRAEFGQAETRLELELPPQTVISRATLWVNGEEQEAAYTSKQRARQAYESIVQTRRDPLLVTLIGKNRALAQAFPIEPKGGKMRFKLGITTALDQENNQARLLLPVLTERNFNFEEQLEHALRFSGPTSLKVEGHKSTQEKIDAQKSWHKINFASHELTRNHRKIILPEYRRNTDTIYSQFEDGPLIEQSIETEHLASAKVLIIIDGSKKPRGFRKSLLNAFEHIPESTMLGMIIMEDVMYQTEIAPWTKDHKKEVLKLVKQANFEGGQNNLLALNKAASLLVGSNKAKILWIHNSQPHDFFKRPSATPKTFIKSPIYSYQITPGSNEVLAYQDLFYQIEAIPRVSTIESDLAFFFNSLGKDKQTNKRKMSPTPQSKEANASAHIAILWASERVFELLQQDKTEEALEIAIKHRIITPVSAAVVLETQAQYEQHNLKQADSSEVHQVSEPQILWLFFCIALFLWLKRRIRLPSRLTSRLPSPLQ